LFRSAFVSLWLSQSKENAREVFCYAWSIAKPLSVKTLDLESAKFLLELFLPPDSFGHTVRFELRILAALC
jgi:hypothetical protein